MTQFFRKLDRMDSLRLAVAAVLGLSAPLVYAGAKTDGSVGAVQTLSGTFTIPQTLGTIKGGNLFHSFQNFSVNTGESATFSTTSALQNVISRVTGGTVSTINGLLKLDAAAGSAPNFFFINPAGVTFGVGASVNVPGAFHVSTADYLKFADGSSFHADLGKSSTFSSSAPESFGFLGTTRASITVKDGATLSTQLLQPISLVAGDIEINNATVSAQGGENRVVALGQVSQEVPLAGNLPAAFGKLNILHGGQLGALSNAAYEGGSVRISAGDITLDSQDGTSTTGIFSVALGAGNSGSMNVTASGKLSVVNAGQITSSAASGAAGGVTVRASDIMIDGGGNAAGIFSVAGTGNAGNVDVAATGTLSFANGGKINSSAFSSGNAAMVRATADSITIDQGDLVFTGIFSEARGGSGKAGNVEAIAGGRLSIANGGQISSATYSAGAAGNVSVNAGSISIDKGAASSTGIFSKANGGTGAAGNVTVDVLGNLFVAMGGQIASNTATSGNAGSVTVDAESVTIDAGGLNTTGTGVFSEAIKGTGNAGSINVTVAKTLLFSNLGSIASSTFSSGAAGNVTVRAGEITIDGKGNGTGLTGIASQAEKGSNGYAGNLDIGVSGKFALINGGVISSSTATAGNAGSVKVIAGSIVIDSGTAATTGIFSTAEAGTGNAGNLEVRVGGGLSITNGGQISTSTATSGNAGMVSITADGGVAITNGGQISSDTFSVGNAGSITVKGDSITIDQGATKRTGIFSQAQVGSVGNAGHVEVTAARNISIKNGGAISTSTFSKGIAGSLKIDANSITIEGQDLTTSGTGIFSTAGQGTGDAGNVDVRVAGELSLKNGGEISSSTSSSGKAGSVTVNAGSVQLSSKSSIRSGANSGSSGQTGSVTVAATEGVTLSNASITIKNQATIGDAAAKLVSPTTLMVTAPRITLDNAQITASSTGNIAASNIIISDTDRLVLHDVSSITTSAVTGKGGSITIQGGGSLLLDHSRITTSVTGVDNGDGGPITINAPILALNTGFIQANTAVPGASGGDVNINVNAPDTFIISSGRSLVTGGVPLAYDPGRFGYNVIQAARPDGVNGEIHISSPQIDLSGSLASLSTRLIDFGNLGSDPCRLGAGSSLTPLGRGGLLPTPSGRVRPSY